MYALEMAELAQAVHGTRRNHGNVNGSNQVSWATDAFSTGRGMMQQLE
jgi:hypothetical protein